MSETELKPCPFCGERAETDFMPEDHSYQIECSDSMGCTARVTRDSELGAIEAWNRRAPAPASSEPVAVPAGMLEPAGIVTVESHKTFLDLSVSEWRDEYPDGEYPVFTAAQVQAMLDAAPRNAPLYDPDDVAFSAWCCAMDDGITAAQKGGQHAER